MKVCYSRHHLFSTCK